jgi:hypothetical protein
LKTVNRTSAITIQMAAFANILLFNVRLLVESALAPAWAGRGVFGSARELGPTGAEKGLKPF